MRTYIPNFESIQILDSYISAKRAKVLSQNKTKYLKSEIKLIYARKSELNHQLYKAHLELLIILLVV